MVFLDFLDFLEFLETSEVAGPGPNPREIDISFGAQWPLACARPDPTIGWTDVLPCVFVCVWGRYPPAAALLGMSVSSNQPPHAVCLTVSTTAAPCAAPPPPFYLLPLAPPARGGLPRSALRAVAHAQQISSSTPPARLRAPAKPRPPCGPHVPTHPPRFQGKQGGILQPPPFWCGG